jgi:hypothetical protein
MADSDYTEEVSDDFYLTTFEIFGSKPGLMGPIFRAGISNGRRRSTSFDAQGVNHPDCGLVSKPNTGKRVLRPLFNKLVYETADRKIPDFRRKT